MSIKRRMILSYDVYFMIKFLKLVDLKYKKQRKEADKGNELILEEKVIDILSDNTEK